LAKDAFEGIAASGVRQAYQRGYSVEEVEVEVNVSTSQSRLVRTSALLKVCLKPNKQTVRSTRTSFLTFSSTALTRKFRLSLANNAEITAEDIYEVPVGACADGTLSLRLCVEPELTRWEHGPSTIFDEFEPERLERVANTRPAKGSDELFPEQVEVCADLHLRPYYGDEDDTDGLYHSVAKRGTTAFHAYATLYARVKNKRYTLAVRRLKDGDTASSVPLSSFEVLLDGLDAGGKATLIDRILRQ